MCKIRNFIAEVYGLKVKITLIIGVKFDRGKKFIGYYIANISNLLLRANIDIHLFAKPFVPSFKVACEIVIWKWWKNMEIVTLRLSAITADYVKRF